MAGLRYSSLLILIVINILFSSEYKPLADIRDYPVPIQKIDSLVVVFYDWVESNYGKDSIWSIQRYDLPGDLLESIARNLLTAKLYYDDDLSRYIKESNGQYFTAYHRMRQLQSEGRAYEKLRIKMTGNILYAYVLENQVKRRLDPRWYFHFKNPYLVVAEPFRETREKIRDYLSDKFYFTDCYVTDDLIGNIHTDQIIVGHFRNWFEEEGVFTKGRLFLLRLNCDLERRRINKSDGYYGSGVLSRMKHIKNYYPVRDGHIIDPQGDLGVYGSNLKVSELKEEIQGFLKAKGVVK